MAEINQQSNQPEEPKRRFGITEISVSNGTSVFLLTMMIMIFGLGAYNTIPKEQFPEVSLPTIFINTPYPGNSAEEIENLVTRPIERELQGVTGIDNITSSSVQDFSVVIAEFGSDENIEEAKRRVKDAIDKAASELPNDLPSDPLVQDINFSELPIVTVNVAGDFPNDVLLDYAEVLEEAIEGIDEIARAEVQGAQERQVRVDLDLPKMQSLKVSFNDVAQAIQAENLTISGGEVVTNDFRRGIRVVGEFENVRELENLIVKAENQRPIYLRDIGKVKYGFADPTSISRVDGLPVISLNVIKRQGQNLLSAADKIKIAIAEAKETLPESLEVSLFNDLSVATREQVSNLENSIISGVILVVLVLLFFLGLKNASFVGLAIPLSILLGVLVLDATGTTMNVVVLFSLILALGLLVDNGIVVIENIYRYMQEGYSSSEAARLGTGEVAVPIIVSTLTTLAAFVPLAFWPGLIGEFFKYMPITLIIVLSSSLFVALVINPVFTSTFMSVDEAAQTDDARRKKIRNNLIGSAIFLILALVFHFVSAGADGGVGAEAYAAGPGRPFMIGRNLMAIALIINLSYFWILRPLSFMFQNSFLPWLERVYDAFVGWALKYAWVVFGGTVAALFAAFGIFAANPPPTEFFPTADPLYVNIFVDLPLGSDIRASDRLVSQIEVKLQSALKPYETIVENVLAQIGENTSDPAGPPEPGFSPNKARISIAFVPSADRGELSTRDAMVDIRESVGEYPGVQIVVDKNSDGPPVGKAINLELRGDEIDELIPFAQDVISYFNAEDIRGIEELKTDVKLGKPELIVNVNRDAARRYGISTYDIAMALRTSVYGSEVSQFKVGEDEYPIFVRLDTTYRDDINALLNQPITFRNPSNGRVAQVPINAVTSIDYSSTYTSIKRKDLKRVITVYSNVTEGANANQINDDLKQLMAAYTLPEGITYEFTGEQEQQAKDIAFLGNAFLLAVFAILIILVAQFNSLSAPIIIGLSILFSLIGVLLGYVFTGQTFSYAMSSIGVISLAGVVVNNAIVLMDYINLKIKERRKELNVADGERLPTAEIVEAVKFAGKTRLRPVLLTAITTVLGLIPLAIGLNINFFTLVSDLDPQYFLGGDNTAFWGPMAWTVVYGLSFATFLTLVVIPVMFLLFYKLELLFSRMLGKGKPEAAISSTDSLKGGQLS
ncbi:MAG: efflux RND transporter permease subunit [Saprospiraceae bacterium]